MNFLKNKTARIFSYLVLSSPPDIATQGELLLCELVLAQQVVELEQQIFIGSSKLLRSPNLLEMFLRITSSIGKLMISLQGMGRPSACA